MKAHNSVATPQKNLVSTSQCRQTTKLYPTCHFYPRSGAHHPQADDRILATEQSVPGVPVCLPLSSFNQIRHAQGVFWYCWCLRQGQPRAALPPDLSTSFDIMDHDNLWQWLTRSFGPRAKSLQWLDSYLTGRTQSVYLNAQSTIHRNILCGVSQGSVLGPLLFTLYMANIGRIIFKLIIPYTTAMLATCNYISTVHCQKLHVLINSRVIVWIEDIAG